MNKNHSQHNLPGPTTTKPTTPGIVSRSAKPVPATMPSPCPEHARRVWNKRRPHKAVESKISRFDDGGVHAYTQKPKFAPGVPNNAMTRNGYLPPGVKTKKTRGGSGDTQTDASYPPVGHTSYGAS